MDRTVQAVHKATRVANYIPQQQTHIHQVQGHLRSGHCALMALSTLYIIS